MLFFWNIIVWALYLWFLRLQVWWACTNFFHKWDKMSFLNLFKLKTNQNKKLNDRMEVSLVSYRNYALFLGNIHVKQKYCLVWKLYEWKMTNTKTRQPKLKRPCWRKVVLKSKWRVQTCPKTYNLRKQKFYGLPRVMRSLVSL